MIIDGKRIAAKKIQDIKSQCDKLPKKPGLAVIWVGENEASRVYIKYKELACKTVGINFECHRPPANTEDVIVCINQLNNRDDISGILLQLPLPDGVDKSRCIGAILPRKDVDGLTPHNLGLLMSHQPGIRPCTPLGCMQLIASVHGHDLSGLNAVVVGRSILVGRPVAIMLEQHNATVTLAHSRTSNLQQLCAGADILVTAIGVPGLFTNDYIKEGATVIDVGISRVDREIRGDVDFASAHKKTGAITPVPGGVGPMTILNLMQNLIMCAQESAG